MSDTHNLKKEVALYYKVFGSLAVLTVVTVAISNLKVGVAMGVFLALVVATTKASLVASVFMHLSHEKKLIYIVLAMTVFFFIGMISLIVLGNYSVPEGAKNLNFEYAKESPAHGGHDDQGKDNHAAEKSGGDH